MRDRQLKIRVMAWSLIACVMGGSPMSAQAQWRWGHDFKTSSTQNTPPKKGLNNSEAAAPPTRIKQSFTLGSRAGLLCWLDASRLQSLEFDAGARVTGLLRGNAVQNTVSQQPKLGFQLLHGKSVLRFNSDVDGAADSLTMQTGLNANASAKDFAVFIVGRYRSPPASGWDVVNANNAWRITSTNTQTLALQSTALTLPVPVNLGESAWIVALNVRNGIGRFYAKNTSGTFNAADMSLGANLTLAGTEAPLDLGEVRIYGRGLSAQVPRGQTQSEFTMVIEELKKKWTVD